MVNIALLIWILINTLYLRSVFFVFGILKNLKLMRRILKKKCFRLLLLLGFALISNELLYCQSLSPSVIASAGDYDIYVSTGYSLCFTLAEMTMIETFSNTGIGFLNQGFHGASDSIFVDVPEIDKVNSLVKIFPNPTHGVFYINIVTNKSSVMDIIIYNSLGKIVYSSSFQCDLGQHTYKFDISNNPEGLYILQSSFLYHTGLPDRVLSKIAFTL